jgi:hypothetical protein
MNMSLKHENNDTIDGYVAEKNMKPVAWIDEETACFVYSQSDYEELSEYDKGGLIPLYTAPRELSDDEIRQIYIEAMESPYTHQQSYFGFARAILKKASEK